MSKTTTETTVANTAEAKKAILASLNHKEFAPKLKEHETQGADSLKGRIGCRTHAIHVVLACTLTPLSTKIITERASLLMGREVKATGSHLNTMRSRGFLTRENGAWALTNAGREMVGTSTDEKPAKKAKKVKAPKTK
jgi:hypothetical protein